MAAGRRGTADERGSSLVLVLVVLLLASLLGISVLFTTELELKTARAYGDAAVALSDTDSAVEEVIWRLRLVHGPGPPPGGSHVTVNQLVDYDAFLDWDPQALRSNGLDDDGDGDADEPDELNLGREWTARILLTPAETHPGPPWEAVDGDNPGGPPWGSKVVLPTIQPEATWRPYSTGAPDELDSLTVRFKLDTDTALGDSEGDGPEIVFYDPAIAADLDDDRNTLTGLGGDGDPLNDSPYNITWSDPANDLVYPASGAPVLLVRATGRVSRGGRLVLKRRVEAEVSASSQALVIAWRELD